MAIPSRPSSYTQAPTEELRLASFQRRVLAIPETFDLFLGGGRGGAKSYTLARASSRTSTAAA